MSPRTRRFAQVDVFGEGPYLGNPVAVVLDADGIGDDEMARFAVWTNLSETTFVLPPTVPGADYRLRIFTPAGELPFAGHPALGSAHAWREAGGVSADPDVIVQECGAGLVPIRADGDALAFRAPELVRSDRPDGPTVARIAAALRITELDIADSQWVDNGPGWIGILLRSANAVLALDPDDALMAEFALAVIGEYPDGAPHRFELRALAGMHGVREDPVTGSANAGVAQWLIGSGRAPSEYTVSQGTRIGRRGVLSIPADDFGDVWVGGISRTLIHGDVLL